MQPHHDERWIERVGTDSEIGFSLHIHKMLRAMSPARRLRALKRGVGHIKFKKLLRKYGPAALAMLATIPTGPIGMAAAAGVVTQVSK